MKYTTRLIAIVASLGFIGCSDASHVGPFSISDPADHSKSPHSLAGTWVKTGEVPGSSEQWIVAVTDSEVVGSGFWTGEACCAGSIAIHGSVAGDSVHLTLSFFDRGSSSGAARFVEHVDAAFTSADDLVGAVQRPGLGSSTAHWQRYGESTIETWTRTGEIPGSSEKWNIAINASFLSGTGRWTGEACCDGSIAVRGTEAGDSLHLDLSFFTRGAPLDAPPRFTSHIDAHRTSPTVLDGLVSVNGGVAVPARWTSDTNPF